MSVVFITGCSTGIGRTAALAFARRGDRVYATMRNPARGEELRAVVDAEHLDVEILTVDVRDDASVVAGVATALATDGRIDVAVNNAGVGPFAPIERTTDEEWATTFDTNVFGAVRLTRAVLPGMRARGEGTIITISSLAGRLAPIPTQGVYAASKHAVCAVTDSIVAECGRFGVRAYCIEPGFFATAIMDKDVVTPLADDDPYRPTADKVEAFFRSNLAEAPEPHAVVDLLLAAADGTIADGVHHPVGFPGLEPTKTAARD